MNYVDAIEKQTEINRMKKALHGRNKLLFILGINSLLRISDLLTIKTADVLDGSGRPKDQLIIKEAKTGKIRQIELNINIKKELRALSQEIKTDPTAYLFASTRIKSQPISRVQAYRILNEAADRAGLTHIKIGTHTMRKTGARALYAKGTPLPLIMKLLGHSSEGMTLKYIGITGEEIRSAYVNLNL